MRISRWRRSGIVSSSLRLGARCSSAECVSRACQAGGCGQANHRRRDGHPEGGRGNQRPKRSAINSTQPPKTRKKLDACMRLSPTLANRRKNHPVQLLLGRLNHRNRRVNYRKPSHLNNHSQGCFQGDIEIFGAGAVTILFDAEACHFPAKEGL